MTVTRLTISTPQTKDRIGYYALETINVCSLIHNDATGHLVIWSSGHLAIDRQLIELHRNNSPTTQLVHNDTVLCASINQNKQSEVLTSD